MNRIIRNLWRVPFFAISAALALYVVCTLTSACGAPVWLTDASSIITLVSASFASIASFIAGLTGNAALAAALATVGDWVTKVQTAITDLQELITQYQSTPSTGLLGDIENALTTLQQNVKQDFSNLGLPSSILSVVAGIAGLAENLLAEWSAAIAGVKTAKTNAEFQFAVRRISVLADALPKAIQQYKADVNYILCAPTGDAVADAALAKVPRL